MLAATAALSVAACGGSKEPAPFKEVPQAKTTTTQSGTATIAPSQSADELLAKLSTRQRQALVQLTTAEQALVSRGEALTAAATDAKALADRVAAGFNPPEGAAPAVVKLRDALTPFGDSLSAIASNATLLPELSTQLQLRSVQLSKRSPADAARLLTAKQQVDSAIADAARMSRDIGAIQSKVREQLSRVTLDGDALGAAATGAQTDAETSVATVSEAVQTGLRALSQAA